MAAREGFVKVRVRIHSGRVTKAVHNWAIGQLKRAGAYARGVMKKQIRPRLKNKKLRTVTFIPPRDLLPPTWKGQRAEPITYYVPDDGPVTVAKTGRPASGPIANWARMVASRRLRRQGEGKPPRRGPTDKLRKNIIFVTDDAKPSVVIGPRPFVRQPKLIGRVTVPQLLNKGGIEVIFGQPVKYGPRPYVETVLKVSLNKLKQNIRAKPVGRR